MWREGEDSSRVRGKTDLIDLTDIYCKYISIIRNEDLRPSVCLPFVTLRLTPLDSETDWTGKVGSKTNLLNWKTKRIAFIV